MNNKIKVVLWLVALVASVGAIWAYAKAPQHQSLRLRMFLSDTGNSDAGKRHKVTLDWEYIDHGRHNIAFTQDGKEWGLDGLTDQQYDSLLNIQ